MADNHHVKTAQKLADQAIQDKLGLDAFQEAKQATEEEHAQTLKQALRENRKAVLWSMAISMCIIMEGYDTILIGNFFAYPEFQRKFGHYYPELGKWQVSGPWQTGLTMAATCGAIIGGLANGWFASRLGYRKVLMAAMMALNCFLFIVFFATGREMLLAGQVLCGLCWGVFATLAPAYASEVCPTNLRGYMTTYVNLCWAIGQLLAAGVLRGCLHIHGEMGYRIPFALQWASLPIIWPTPIIVLAWFAPESPWFLVRSDRLEEAKHNIHRLSGDKTEAQINAQLAMMLHTTTVESQVSKGATYLDCFRGVNIRRSEICMLAFIGQILSGSSFAYTPTYFFTSAGMESARAFEMGLGAKAFGFIGTVCSWFLITRFGRRTLYVSGLGCLFVILFIIGILNVSAHDRALWPSGALCVVWLFVYSLTIGPVTYSIISETSSVRLRPLAVVLARNAYQVVNIVSIVLQTYMMNPTEWNLQGKTGFVWGSTCFCMFVWSFFRMPEVKGRTYEELDILFKHKVPARKFAATQVDAYGERSAEPEFKEEQAAK